VGNGGDGWCGVVNGVVVVVQKSDQKHKQGKVVWSKKPKPSRRGSLSGALCETAVGEGGKGWWRPAAAAI
jgi:hypothetical protein